MRICELKQKDVINVCTCKSLGCPLDVEFDCKTGVIQAIIVPVPGKMCGFFGAAGKCLKMILKNTVRPPVTTGTGSSLK